MTRKQYIIVLWLAILCVLSIALAVTLAPLRVVVSDSMAPTYNPGDALLLRPILGEITPGMVISYQYQGKLITHRVAGLENGLLVTRGDNNQDVDPWRVSPSAVVGTPWLRLPYLGHLIFFLRTPAGWGLLVILPAVWIVYDELRKIHRLWREARQP